MHRAHLPFVDIVRIPGLIALVGGRHGYAGQISRARRPETADEVVKRQRGASRVAGDSSQGLGHVMAAYGGSAASPRPFVGPLPLGPRRLALGAFASAPPPWPKAPLRWADPPVSEWKDRARSVGPSGISRGVAAVFPATITAENGDGIRPRTAAKQIVIVTMGAAKQWAAATCLRYPRGGRTSLSSSSSCAIEKRGVGGPCQGREKEKRMRRVQGRKRKRMQSCAELIRVWASGAMGRDVMGCAR